MAEFVVVEVRDRVATIRLDRPKMNALSAQVQAELRDAALEVSAREDVGAVVLWGGPRIFAAGADVKEMAGMSYAQMLRFAPQLSECFTAVARIPKPVVAAINGYALGGGLELALCADVRFAAENAIVGQPEILLGIIPGAGGTQRLSRLIGPARTKDLCFTGRQVRSAEALALGVVDRVVAADAVYEEAVAYAAGLAGGAGLALRAVKLAVDDGLTMSLDDGLRLESHLFSSLFATEDQTTGMTSFLSEGPGKARFSSR